MYDEIFTLSLSGAIAILFVWAFQTLTKENWQILACLPRQKGPDGIWRGLNLTYYGFFSALAYLVAVVMFLVMMGSFGITIVGALSIVTPFLAICIPASRLVARWIEKKPHTFSVGGASFVGILAGPWILLLINRTIGHRLGFQVSPLETLAAMLIAYAFGEGIGRLACISFGCCYGKPLEVCHPFIRSIFQRRHFIFWGKTKKIAYAHKLEGQAVVPVQALTAVIYTGTGLISFYILVKGFATTSLVITLIVTQGWRFVSEFLRADYRGHGRISAYQLMNLFAIFYTLVVISLVKESAHVLPDLSVGINSLWNPGLLIFLVLLWLVAFVYTGKSSVTCSSISIRIVEKNT